MRPLVVIAHALRVLVLAVLVGALVGAHALAVAAPAPEGSPSTERLATLADEFFAARQDRLLDPRFTPEANRAWVGRLRGFERRLAAVDVRHLGPQGRITARMLASDLGDERRYVEDGWLARDVNGSASPLHSIVEAARLDHRSVGHWRWLITTLRGADGFATSYAAVLRSGLDAGRPQHREAVRSAIASLDVLVTDDPATNPFLELDERMARALAGRPGLAAMRAELDAVIQDTVLPAHRELRRFLAEDYLPRAGRVGADRAAYLHHIAGHLGPDAPSPEALHRFGRAEVERLLGELDRTIAVIAPKAASRASFMAGLSRRRANRYAGPDDLIAAARVEIVRARELARRQVAVPRGAVEVRAVPRHQEATVSAQYYPASETLGIMEVNTGALLATQRRTDLATLVTHEVYGGHHLASLYASKNRDRSVDYRRGAGTTAFDEGWALYMEDMRDRQGGFTPEERVGFLVNHLWRAARLVVDTGLHTGAMTPAAARAYLRRSAFLAPDAAAAEVRRYLDWPGQALAYYVGKRQFLAIRADAERVLGDRFDVRRFHARLLALGSVPMAEAAREMASWSRRRLGQLDRQTTARGGRATMRGHAVRHGRSPAARAPRTGALRPRAR